MSKQSSKPKQVRDSFTMPKDDYALIDALKARAVDGKRPAKKSELLRAGLHALLALNTEGLTKALDKLAPVKTGRPKAAPGKDAPKPAAPAKTVVASKAPAAPKAAAPVTAKRAAVRKPAAKKPAARPSTQAAATKKVAVKKSAAKSAA